MHSTVYLGTVVRPEISRIHPSSAGQVLPADEDVSMSAEKDDIESELKKLFSRTAGFSEKRFWLLDIERKPFT